MVGRDWSGTAGDADGGTLGGATAPSASYTRRRSRSGVQRARDTGAGIGHGMGLCCQRGAKGPFCRYCSDRLAAPSSVSRPRGSRRSQPRSTKGIPAVRILSVPESNSASGPSVPVHPRDGRCLRSEFSPGSKQRPAELQVAAAAEFRRVIVDYLDRNVVEPQTILIEPPDGSANRSDRPVSGTVCR